MQLIKKCRIAEARPGMKLGRAVFSRDGTLLLDVNVRLSAEQIEHLIRREVSELVIVQEQEVGLLIDTLHDERLKFVMRRESIIATVADVLYRLNHFEQLSPGQVFRLADQMLVPLLVHADRFFSYLHIIDQQKGDYLFRHSVNVAVYAGILGTWLHWTPEKIRELVVAGLLHDIGKVNIPVRILDKPGKLTPEEMSVMKQHVLFGYEFLRDTTDISELVKRGVLEHHERLDGSGYPSGLAGDQISEIGRIIAVADVYDAMTSKRVYREAISPIVAMRELYQTMFGAMDAKICLTFIDHAKKCLVGSLVKLSNGLIAKIIQISDSGFSDPVVQMATGECIALEKQENLKIVEFVY